MAPGDQHLDFPNEPQDQHLHFPNLVDRADRAPRERAPRATRADSAQSATPATPNHMNGCWVYHAETRGEPWEWRWTGLFKYGEPTWQWSWIYAGGEREWQEGPPPSGPEFDDGFLSDSESGDAHVDEFRDDWNRSGTEIPLEPELEPGHDGT